MKKLLRTSICNLNPLLLTLYVLPLFLAILAYGFMGMGGGSIANVFFALSLISIAPSAIILAVAHMVNLYATYYGRWASFSQMTATRAVDKITAHSLYILLFDFLEIFFSGLALLVLYFMVRRVEEFDYFAAEFFRNFAGFFLPENSLTLGLFVVAVLIAVVFSIAIRVLVVTLGGIKAFQPMSYGGPIVAYFLISMGHQLYRMLSFFIGQLVPWYLVFDFSPTTDHLLVTSQWLEISGSADQLPVPGLAIPFAILEIVILFYLSYYLQKRRLSVS
ncbi:MAG: hypothetical protein Q4E76_03655 [Tissierellia bacterium]|nr:hypothetical protein [Tissierellia bacterium]